MKKAALFLTLVAFMIPIILFAQGKKDINGGKDNPLISRFSNSYIGYYKTVKRDTYILPVSKIKNKGGEKDWDKKLKLKGKVNRIQYTTDKKNIASLVYVNYLSALKKSNWEILFSGSGDNELGNESYEWQYYMFQEGLGLDKKFGSKHDFRGNDYAYIAAKFEDNGISYYAVIYIIEKDNFTMINQDIITLKKPD